RALVRFRAMVQDTTPSPEMYLPHTAAGSLCGWGLHADAAAADDDVDYSQIRECSVLWAVSVPGETEWCRAELGGDGEHTPEFLYDLDAAHRLQPTDVATFVGILTREPYVLHPSRCRRTAHCSFRLDLEAETSADVPTLHVLFVRTHEQSLLTRPYPSAHPPPVRQQLIEWIAAEALGGDLDAAEWVLLASIAKVQSRTPALLPPSLTLAHFPAGDQAPPALAHVLAQLLPLSCTLPLSLAALNAARFAPESEDEDLHAGALQLPRGCSLLVTEGGVREGTLVERGLANLRALQDVLSAQTLAYRFPFSQFAFPTDLRCIVLSEGAQSAFFRTDLSVALRPAAGARLYKPAADVATPPPATLAAFRDLVVGAQTGKVHVGETTAEHVQQDFVRDRQQDAAVTSEDLIRRMTVAKLYALSLHAPELTVDIWERAKAFDERRRARL
ncbi:hypothetical protein PHLGIDRAFT_79981, partial [Phlebiopsis gigantea 11061_1 CR5-6]